MADHEVPQESGSPHDEDDGAWQSPRGEDGAAPPVPSGQDSTAIPEEPAVDQDRAAAIRGGRVTYDELTMMASILALNPDADPARWGWDEEPHRTEWNILRAQILDMKARGIGIDPG